MNHLRYLVSWYAILASMFWVSVAHSRDPEPLVVNVKVIRRALDIGGNAGTVRDWAHSAVLLTTDNVGIGSRGSFVLEYTKGGVTLTPANLKLVATDEKNSTMKIKADGYDFNGKKVNRYEWTSQLRGVNLSRTKNYSPEGLKQIMHDVVGNNEYDIRRHNCHDVQEEFRRRIGLTVD